MIIGPYNFIKGNMSNKGDIFVFQVIKDICYKLPYTVVPVKYLNKFDYEQMKRIIDEYKTYPKRVPLDEKWRRGLTYREKILGALKDCLDENAAELKKKNIAAKKDGLILEEEKPDPDAMFYLDTEDNINKLMTIIKNEF